MEDGKGLGKELEEEERGQGRVGRTVTYALASLARHVRQRPSYDATFGMRTGWNVGVWRIGRASWRSKKGW